MIDDKKLDELLASYKPVVNGDDRFMKDVNRRLDAIDYALKYRDMQMRQYRRKALFCFVAGAIVGVLMTVAVILLPSPAELFVFSVKSKILLAVIDNLHYVILSVCALMLVYGLYGVMATREDLRLYSLLQKKVKLTLP